MLMQAAREAIDPPLPRRGSDSRAGALPAN